MQISEFKLERYFAQHEFSAQYLLSSSDSQGLPLQAVLEQASDEALELWSSLELGYTESLGSPLLRETILQHYRATSIDHVLVSSPGELHFSLMNVLLSPDDHVIIAGPCYQAHYAVVEAIGCQISMWLPDPTTWQFDTDALDELTQEHTKLIVVNFPHNPTGSYWDAAQQQAIINIASKFGAYVYSDEMYYKLAKDQATILPPLSDLYDKGISLWGTSKSLGAAGLRVGWLVAQDRKLLMKVAKFKDYLSICTNAPSEVLTMILLNQVDHFLKINVDRIQRNIALFEQFVDEQTLFKSFIKPQAGSTAFVELDIEESALDFSDRLVEQANVMALPSEMFDYPGKYLRIGFGRDNFAKSLEVLGDHLKGY
ncbi:MAG: aminotransferase class I/II-fold pyridoxal phosphate-dependent enzyme [Bacteroidota bacterium]